MYSVKTLINKGKSALIQVFIPQLMGNLPYGGIYILRALRPVREENHPVLY